VAITLFACFAYDFSVRAEKRLSVEFVLEAMKARAAQLTSGDLSYSSRNLANPKTSHQLDFIFITDGRRAMGRCVMEKSWRWGFDGKTFCSLREDTSQANLKDSIPEKCMPTMIDPRYFNDLEPRLTTYLLRHQDRVTLNQPKGETNVITLDIEVPKEDLETAFLGWPRACSEGAHVTIWVKLSEGFELIKQEMRGGAKAPYEGILGSTITWSNWVKRDPGVWLPTAVEVQVYGVKDQGKSPITDMLYSFDKVNLTKKFTDGDFRLAVPAGYTVHDVRGGTQFTYVSHGGFPALREPK